MRYTFMFLTSSFKMFYLSFSLYHHHYIFTLLVCLVPVCVVLSSKLMHGRIQTDAAEARLRDGHIYSASSSHGGQVQHVAVCFLPAPSLFFHTYQHTQTCEAHTLSLTHTEVHSSLAA